MPAKIMRISFSLFGVVLLFGAFILAPTPVQQPVTLETHYFAPGVMPSQELITAAYEEAKHLTDPLAVEVLPEPEPEPIQVIEESQAENQAHLQAAPPPQFSGGGSPEAWMAAAGIAPADWGYVDFIASKESGWNPNATNPSSGACGLIQAYPCSKVPGSGYNPVDNLTWANGYAVSRYGSWKAAYDFWVTNWWW